MTSTTATHAARRSPAFSVAPNALSTPSSPSAPSKELDWRREAACAHLSGSSVFTRVPAEAEAVLRACDRCPIRKQCEAVVDPSHTWFDGVSGGRLWRNGREVSR
ncbi:WhiB family transcriptional regulator [Streptomyces sp. NPDC048484]|uniref:WhiB family transcriptional regulator n=1 Tax=Streptomyces sp. NPDC048484 TaxID=3155146 RepID=UPI00343C7644